MPIVTSNLWKAEVNTKLPALSHYFSYRINGVVCNTATTTPQVFTLPSNYSSPVQIALGTTSAPTATYNDPNSEPQFLSSVFVPTNFCIRNPNGPFVASGTSAAGSLTISLYNTNISAVNALTGVVTRAAATAVGAANTYASGKWTASATHNQMWTVDAQWDLSCLATQVNTYTDTLATGAAVITNVPVAFTSAANLNGFITSPVRFGLGDSLAIAVQPDGNYVLGGTKDATCTGFTVDVFGYWLQTV
jgi:hypothetical protein